MSELERIAEHLRTTYGVQTHLVAVDVIEFRATKVARSISRERAIPAVFANKPPDVVRLLRRLLVRLRVIPNRGQPSRRFRWERSGSFCRHGWRPRCSSGGCRFDMPVFTKDRRGWADIAWEIERWRGNSTEKTSVPENQFDSILSRYFAASEGSVLKLWWRSRSTRLDRSGIGKLPPGSFLGRTGILGLSRSWRRSWGENGDTHEVRF